MRVSVNNKNPQNVIATMVVTILFSALIGSVVAVAASIFVRGIEWFTGNHGLIGELSVRIWDKTLNFNGFAIIVAAGLCLMMLRKVLPISRYHGPADSIHIAHSIDKKEDVREGFLSTCAAFISLSGGAPVGQYGPLVHLGTTLSLYLRRTIPKIAWQNDIFVGCGVAAAISAGFHAPIAGIVFAHEAVIRHLSFRAVVPIAISSVISFALFKYLFSGSTLLRFAPVDFQMHAIAPLILFSGLFFGFVAIVMMSSLFYSNKLAQKLKLSAIQLIFLGSLMLGILSVFWPELLGSKNDQITRIFLDGDTVVTLIMMAALQILGLSIALSCGIYGGVFSPALFVGALSGGFMGGVFSTLGLTSHPELFVVAGMSAVAACVVGAPISMFLIILEITDLYDVGVLSMLATVTAVLVSSAFHSHSFFDEQLRLRGVDLSKGRANIHLSTLKMGDFCHQEFVGLAPGTTAEKAIKVLTENGYSEGYVINEGSELFGKVSLVDLLQCDSNQKLDKALTDDFLRLKTSTNVIDAMNLLQSFVGESVPVIESSSYKIAGVVSEADIFKIFADTQDKISRQEH